MQAERKTCKDSRGIREPGSPEETLRIISRSSLEYMEEVTVDEAGTINEDPN